MYMTFDEHTLMMNAKEECVKTQEKHFLEMLQSALFQNPRAFEELKDCFESFKILHKDYNDSVAQFVHEHG
jgi:hypothetical protein